MATPCYVYMMEMNAPIYGRPPDHSIFKIGISINADRRYSEIKTASPFPVRVVETWRLPHKGAARAVEVAFHSANKKKRMLGEWFCDDGVGAMCSVGDLIAEYWYQVWGTRGLVDFLVSTGIKPEEAEDICLSLYGETGLE